MKKARARSGRRKMRVMPAKLHVFQNLQRCRTDPIAIKKATFQIEKWLFYK